MEKEAYTRCLKETFAIEAEYLREGAAAVDRMEFEKRLSCGGGSENRSLRLRSFGNCL